MESNNNSKDGDCLDLDESLTLATDALEKVIETNDLENGIQMLEPFAHKSLYHSSLRTIFLILNAGLTLQKDDFKRATDGADQTYYMVNKYRRHGFFNSLFKMFKTPDYNKYTDIEIHSEIIYAKFLGMSAILCALDAHNIYSLIKIAYRLRLCVNAFKECRTIMRNRTIWETENSRLNFEAGVRLANGLQHLAISQIPPKLLKIVNFLGYKGVESRGFQELNKTAFELPGISSRVAQVVLLYFWVVVQPHAFLGPKDLTQSQNIIEKELKRFPKSLLYRLAKGYSQQIDGRIDEAIETFSDCLIENNLLISHKIFHLELMFCFALKFLWTECIENAEFVQKQAIHSPAIITFILANFIYAKSVDENDPQSREKALQLYRSIPSMRIRYFGKTITPEKIAVDMSKKYSENNESIVLPEMDLLYSANFLVFIKNNKTLLNKHLERVDKHVVLYEKDLQMNNNLNNYSTALFYRAVLLKYMSKFNESKDCFHRILDQEARLDSKSSLPAQIALELGLIEMEENNSDEAKKWFEKALKNSGYLNENFVHLRAYAALRELGVNNDKQNDDKTNCKEMNKEWLKDMEIEEKYYEKMVQKERLVLM